MAKRSSENNKFTFEWEIENFSFCPMFETLLSPLFNIKTSNITSWCLCLNYNDETLFLVKKGINYEGEIGYKTQIIDNTGKMLLSTDCDKCSYSEDKEEDELLIMISDGIKNIDFNKITIRCIIILPEKIVDCVSACKARTKIEIEQCSFKWNVKNFAIVDEVSKIFCCSPLAQIKMTLTKNETFVLIAIEGTETVNDTFIVCKIALLDLHGFVSDFRRSGYIFGENESNIWIFPNFIKTSDIFSESFKYHEYDTFSLKCDFSICKGTTLEEVEYRYYGNLSFLEQSTTINTLANLQENFRRMYIKHLQTDVKLQSGEHTLEAHKFVLSARSPVFAAMFDKDMLESQTGVVNIPDIEVKILDFLLQFMYDGTLGNMDYDSAYKLLIAADKYQVPVLKELCSAFLMTNLSNENACDVLTLADKVAHEMLKDSAIHYIVKHADVILTTEIWAHFVQINCKLVTEIVGKIANLLSFL